MLKTLKKTYIFQLNFTNEIKNLWDQSFMNLPNNFVTFSTRILSHRLWQWQCSWNTCSWNKNVVTKSACNVGYIKGCIKHDSYVIVLLVNRHSVGSNKVTGCNSLFVINDDHSPVDYDLIWEQAFSSAKLLKCVIAFHDRLYTHESRFQNTVISHID